MFKFLSRFKRRGVAHQDILAHNLIDHAVMSRLLGVRVLARDFKLEEDLHRDLCEGVVWRRRRFRFLVAEGEGENETERPEGLCINEVTLEAPPPGKKAAAELTPCLAADYPHLVDFPEIENAYWATTFASGAIRGEKGVRETRLYINPGKLFFSNGSHDVQQAAREIMSLANRGSAPEDLVSFDYLDHRIVQQPAGGFGVARYLPAFPPSRLVQSDARIHAATNAGYFLNFPEEYDDGISALHQPVGGHMIDGRLVAPPWIRRPGIVHFTNGKTAVGLFGPEDMEIVVGDLPPVPLRRGTHDGDPQGTYWRAFGEDEIVWSTDIAQLVYTANVLVSVEPFHKGTQPPKGGGVVYISGDHARAALEPGGAAKVQLRLRRFEEGEPQWMISSGPFLVRDGKPVDPAAMLSPEHAGEFGPGGAPPTRFPFDTSKTAAPRTAFGVLPSGGFKIVVVDGRRSGEHSPGITLEGLSHLMQWVGCETAINLDGGGSSVLALEGATRADALRENSHLGVVNIPSDADGRERIVPVFLIVREKG